MLQADDVMRQLSDKLQPGFLTSRDEFITSINNDAGFRPFGDLLHSYTVSKGNIIFGVDTKETVI